jgi:hypothetical protein
MMALDLNTYITKARDKKLTDEQIKKQLIDVGWPTEQITEAIAQQSDLPVPPIPPVAHVNMWTGFLYIIFFISLFILSSAISGIFNAWIDKPLNGAVLNTTFAPDLTYDLLSNYLSIDTISLIRGYIAAIIVSYPVFLFLAITLKKQLKSQPSIKSVRTRKILIYITLIGTFLILLGSGVIGIYDYLAGNITGITIRHFLVTILISGPIFVFFINEVKNDRKII